MIVIDVFLARPKTNLLLIACLALSSYLLVLAAYRLFFSPLSKFPGPKLAALTRWYEFYYDVVLRGQFTFHIEDLHKRYGMDFALLLLFRRTFISMLNQAQSFASPLKSCISTIRNSSRSFICVLAERTSTITCQDGWGMNIQYSPLPTMKFTASGVLR